RPRPSGEVSTTCMSRARGEIARAVIVALEPSTKKRTPEKSPTPSVTPTSDASVRRGLRTRSRRTYLSIEPPIAEADRPVHALRDRRVVGDHDERGSELPLRRQQEVDHGGRVPRVE